MENGKDERRNIVTLILNNFSFFYVGILFILYFSAFHFCTFSF